MSYTIPPDTRAVGTGNPAGDMNNVSDVLSGLGAAYNVLNTAYSGGADPTGVADSTAAIQAAITAAANAAASSPAPVSGAPAVLVPAGNFLISSPLSIAAPVRILGIGPASRIFSNASGIFDFGNNYITHLQVSNLTLDATGGHIFTNFNLHRSSFRDLVLIQRSGNYSIGTLGTTGTGLSTTDFDNIVQYVYPDPVSNVRSVPAWSLTDATGSGKNLDGITFRKVASFNQANAAGAVDNTQFIFDIACTVAGSGGLADRITFAECDFGNTLGGGIRCRSVQGLLIEQPGFGNIYTQGTPSHSIGNSMIYVGQYSGAAASQSPVIIGYLRESSGTMTFGTFSDIEVDAATTNATIIAPDGTGASTNPAVKINLNGSAGAQVVNAQSNVAISNPAGDTIVTGNGTIQLGGVDIAQNTATPGNNGLQAENFDITACQSSGGAMVAGTVYAMRIDIKRQITVTNLWYWVTSAAATAVVGENFIGIYNSAGTQLAKAGIDSLLTANAQNATITATTLAPGTYYVLMVVNATTMPSLARSAATVSMCDINTATSLLRFAVNATAQTALPSPATLGSNVATNAFPFWVGLS